MNVYPLLPRRGFTLIELLIATSLIGILITFAYPSYQGHVAKSRRTNAMGEMLISANKLERYYAAHGEYSNASAGKQPDDLIRDQIPASGKPDYQVTLKLLPVGATIKTGYILTAIPTGAQATDGKLVLTHTGIRKWDKDNNDQFSDSENSWLSH